MGTDRERRLGDRRPVRTRARIIDNAGFATDVVVRDISMSGVRLEVPAYADIPKRFLLRGAVTGKGDLPTELVWRNGVDLGARFLSADELTPSAPKPSAPAEPTKRLSVAELRDLARRKR